MKITDLIPNIHELIPYEYSTIKSPLYEDIINHFLSQADNTSTPVLIHPLGAPGSGKTTFYTSNSWSSHVLVAFDNIMEAIPQYQSDCQNLGNVKAFEKWQIPARIIGYELLRRAIEQKKNIFFDHGGSNQGHIQLIKSIKKYRYTSEMHFIDCPLEICLQRCTQREKQIHRHTPKDMVISRHNQTKLLIDQYKKICDKFVHHKFTNQYTDN
ncbi:MAG: hypothetical protein E7019_00835 [Alphaproteobacteria bacterium]|nr:hypothetical protein [Alphaproteobacteria bacterium]